MKTDIELTHASSAEKELSFIVSALHSNSKSVQSSGLDGSRVDVSNLSYGVSTKAGFKTLLRNINFRIECVSFAVYACLMSLIYLFMLFAGSVVCFNWVFWLRKDDSPRYYSQQEDGWDVYRKDTGKLSSSLSMVQ